jgi:hypothetical protein
MGLGWIGNAGSEDPSIKQQLTQMIYQNKETASPNILINPHVTENVNNW